MFPSCPNSRLGHAASSCQERYVRLYVSLTCSWAASDMRRPGSARTAVDDAGAAASGAAGASGAVGATGIARTGRCMGVYLRSGNCFFVYLGGH